jgi:hypothetical protein
LSLCLTNKALRHEDVWGNGYIDPRILELRHWLEVSGEHHALAALPPGKGPRYPLNERLGGPYNRSGRCEDEKNLARTGT